MNRKEYLDRLRISLQGLPMDEIEDILSDYEEHFNIGISKGKSEEEISKELGDPREVANSYRTTYRTNDNRNNYNINTSDDNTRKVLITLVLIAFNVIVAGPYLGLVGLLLGLYGLGIGLGFGGLVALFGFPISFFSPLPTPHILTSISFGIGFLALGVLGIILAVYLTKEFYKLTVRYIKWNLELINK